MARRLLVDLGPLKRSGDFRWLFSGQLVSTLGSQLTVVAVPYQVFRMTHSPLDVGLVSVAQLVPLLVCSLIGGSVADAHDKRRVLLVAELGLAAATVGLAVNAGLPQPQLWPLYLVPALTGALLGFDRPAFNASIPNMVGPGDLPAAYALWQVQLQVGTVVGPAVAGLLLSVSGLSTVYWIDVASFVVSFFTVVAFRPQPPRAGAARVGLRSVVEGLRYVKAHQIVQGVYLLDLNAMVFGMPRALFPALGLDFFHGGARAVGLLYAAPGAGALLGALMTGWVAEVRRQGRAVIVAVIVWGAAITLFGLVDVFAVALLLLVIAGWADVVSAVFRNTILQSTIPEHLRGRLSAIQIAIVQGGPRLGDLEAGAVAQAFTVEASIVSGGLACVVGAVALAGLLPRFRNQEAVTVNPVGEARGPG